MSYNRRWNESVAFLDCFSPDPKEPLLNQTSVFRYSGLLTLGISSALAAPIAAAAQDDAPRGDAFHAPVATMHYARSRDYHDTHLKLIFNVSYKNHTADGDVTHTIIPFRQNLKAVVMDAGSNLKISAVTIDGASAKFTHENNLLTITPPRPLQKHQPVVVNVKYFMPNPTAHGGANGQGGFKFIDPSPSDPFRKPGFWTQGETETNRYWVPCFDFPDDKCTSEEIVTVPDNFQVIGNGSQGPTTVDKAKHTATFRWTMTQPHSTYLLSLVGGELDIVKDDWAGVPLLYACPKGMGDKLKASFGHTPDMLQFFSDTLGVKYPWPKYAQSFVYDFPGGMENVSATTLGSFGGLVDARSNIAGIASLTSHELGHQWFGDLVTCQDWGDTWLNESFATFMQMIYDEHKFGRGAYEDTVESNRQGYFRSRTLHALSTQMYANADTMFDSSHTYDKGGVILHMLRRYLGDEDFYHALGHYLHENAYKPVVAADLEKAIFESSGKNVRQFFDQWIFAPGHPVFTPSWTYDEVSKTINLHIKQLQDTSDGTPAVYKIALTVGILRSNTSVHLEKQIINLTKADEEFKLPADTKPDAVLIDPDHDLLRELKDVNWTDDQIPAILLYASNAQDRKYALTRLKPGGDVSEDKLVQIYSDALKTEYHTGNAVTLISRLGEFKRESLRPLLREQVRSTQINRRPAAIEALAKLPPTAQDTALIHNIAISDTEPYNVVEAALTALAKTALKENLDVFRHQLASKSLADRLAMRSVSLLSDSKEEAVGRELITATAPSYARRVRSEAISGLENQPVGSAPVHAALLKIIQSEDLPAVQVTAVRVLGNRKDAAATDALKALQLKTKDQTVKDAVKSALEAIETK